MKNATAPLLALTLGLLLLVANAHAQDAKTVPLVNASFESPIIEEGSFAGGVPGWQWIGSYRAVNATIHPGGPSSAEPWPSTPPFGLDGKNFCQLFATDNGGTGVLCQDTGIKYQPGVTYTLTAAFGLQTNPGQKLAPNCTIFLGEAGVNGPRAWTFISEANLTPGEFKDQSVSYTPAGSGTSGDVLVGVWLNYGPAQSYLDVDNMRLKITKSLRPVPSPSPTPAPSLEQPNYFGTHM